MARKRQIIWLSLFLLLITAVGVAHFWPRMNQVVARLIRLMTMPLYEDAIPVNGDYTNLIFLHNSTGRNLIAEGNVRPLLQARGYQFWDHDYNHIGLTNPDGSLINAQYRIPGRLGRGDTNVAGLAALFAQPVTDPPDNAFSRLMQHEVIIVKSCFPNSAIHDAEMQQQYQDRYLQMRNLIDTHPDRMFIILTSPPLHPLATNPEEAARARHVANWLTSDDFLLGHPNLFVFDFFELLADPISNTLRTAYQKTPLESQSHPNQLANETIGPLFVDFVDTAVQTYRDN